MTDDYTKSRDEAAEKYRDEDFKKNPDGYTIAPYVNDETTEIAFRAGADWANNQARVDIEQLKAQLQMTNSNWPHEKKLHDKLAEAKAVIQACVETLTKGYPCEEHDMEPNTTMDFFRCDKCGIRPNLLEVLERARKWLEKEGNLSTREQIV